MLAIMKLLLFLFTLMDIQKTLQNAKGVAFLNTPSMDAVARDAAGLKPALSVAALASLVSALGYFIFPVSYGILTLRPDLSWVLGHAITSFIFLVVGFYLVGYLAEHVFKAKMSIQNYVHVLGHGSIVGLIGILPALAPVGAIWMLVIAYRALRDLGKMTTESIVILLILQLVLMGAITYSVGVMSF